MKQKFFGGLALLFIVYATSTVGFLIIGWPQATFLDAIYMTTITLTTVGYGEVIAIAGNPSAQLFTIVIQICGIGTLFYMVTTATAFIVEGELALLLGRRRMDKQIAKMCDHYIVAGGGDTAQHIIGELNTTGRKTVFIENDPARVQLLSKMYKAPYVVADATSEEALETAGIYRATGIIFALPDDGDNVLGVITARTMKPDIRIVAKGVDTRVKDKMIKAGADYVVNPNFIGGMRMVSEMIRPHAVAFIDDMLRLRGKAIRLEEVVLGESSMLINTTLGDCNIQHDTGFLIVAVREKGEREFIPSPSPKRKFQAGDVLIVMGDPKKLDQLSKYVGAAVSHQVTKTTLQKISDM